MYHKVLEFFHKWHDIALGQFFRTKSSAPKCLFYVATFLSKWKETPLVLEDTGKRLDGFLCNGLVIINVILHISKAFCTSIKIMSFVNMNLYILKEEFATCEYQFFFLGGGECHHSGYL
jgi:hypothetical protein